MKYAVLLSFFGGIVPAILWLKFWLRESTHTEPRRLIVGTFALGMASVFVAGLLETAVAMTFTEFTLISFFIWAFIEEGLKLISSYIVGIKSRFCDEPIDPSIYLITSALGFAAAENILFLFEPLSSGDLQTASYTLTLRFVGATLLHVIASGSIGMILGFAFYKSKGISKTSIVSGLLVATLLHTAFNGFMIREEFNKMWVFIAVWLGLLVTILLLERIKNTKRIKLANSSH